MKAPANARFARELQDFLNFVRRPRPGPRWPGRRSGSRAQADWLSLPPLRRMLQWAAFLWAVNLMLLGPIAVAAATAGGAQHKLALQAVPWMQALLWAPLVEELVFRYGLRRVGQAFWLTPLATGILFSGPTPGAGLLLCAVVLLSILPQAEHPWGRRVRHPGRTWARCRAWRNAFPWLFHGASLAFAAVHLYNFNLSQTPWWLLPLLVLPQWLTGLALGWMRVRRGIGAAVLLHALFNAGPLLLVWLILRQLGELTL